MVVNTEMSNHDLDNTIGLITKDINLEIILKNSSIKRDTREKGDRTLMNSLERMNHLDQYISESMNNSPVAEKEAFPNVFKKVNIS